jgi:hypothetical protein
MFHVYQNRDLTTTEFFNIAPLLKMHFVHHRKSALLPQNKEFWAEKQMTHAPLHPFAGA